MLFRMVPKQVQLARIESNCFRVMLFRMVPKPTCCIYSIHKCFRVMLFRMVPKLFRPSVEVQIEF